MHRNVRNRLSFVLIILFLVSLGIGILLYFLSDNIVFFLKPSEIKTEHYDRKIRIGGLVQESSIKDLGSGEVSFILSDKNNDIMVHYKGILPALFRENQGMVAEGYLKKGNILYFKAEKLLTKHDENYKPPEDE